MGKLEYSQLADKHDKTQSITFRLPKKILEQIELEAKQNNTSENVLVRQILTNHIEWTQFSNGIRMLPITHESFRTIAKNLDSREINNIVENMSSLIKNLSIIRTGRYDLAGAFESLSLYLKMSNLSFAHIKDQEEHRFMITHDLGMEWTLMLEQFLKKVFLEFTKEHIRFTTSDDAIIASLRLL